MQFSATYIVEDLEEMIFEQTQNRSQRFDQFERMFQMDHLRDLVLGRLRRLFSVQMNAQTDQLININHSSNQTAQIRKRLQTKQTNKQALFYPFELHAA